MNLHSRLQKIEDTLNPPPRDRGPYTGLAARMRARQALRVPPPTNPARDSLAWRMQQRGACDLV
jgi:hypothetical protein